MELYNQAGNITAIYDNRKDIRALCPDASDALAKAINTLDTHISRAEKEYEYSANNGISILTIGDTAYPTRLLNCNDAPSVLYHLGNTDLNSRHIISMVGTRQCSEYGKDVCRTFISELKSLIPDAIIVSGLAYGIDIHCHRNALDNGLDTVAVLAHGLDRIYPSTHRSAAAQIIHQGGLLTEYMSGTTPERQNFLARNRIVAALSDATIVVESNAHGGSLVTATIANKYNREVFAIPGNIYSATSEGCNNLISDNMACLLTSAQAFTNFMGWEASTQPEAVQRELFIELTPEETAVLSTLTATDGKHISAIINDTHMPYNKVSSTLVGLELKGMVKSLGGSLYRKFNE